MTCSNNCSRCCGNCGCCPKCGPRPPKNDCVTRAVCGCQGKNCQWYPIKETPPERKMRLCCDQNGFCGMYPEDCRNTFWPDFAHPRWLCCRDLYCARRKNQCC